MESLRRLSLDGIASTFHNICVITSAAQNSYLNCFFLLARILRPAYAGIEGPFSVKGRQGEGLQKDKTELIFEGLRLLTFVRCGIAAFKDTFFVPALRSLL